MKIYRVSIIIFFWVYTHSLYGCSCIETETVDKAIASYDVVIEAKILSLQFISDSIFMEKDSLGNNEYMFITSAKYTINVKRIFKGKKINDTMEIITGIGGGDCGYSFKLKKKYIVYGTIDNTNTNKSNQVNYISTDICSRTRITNMKEIRNIKKLVPNKS